MTGFEAFLQQYGWLGFMAYVAVKELLPFFRDKVYPHKVAEAKAERERLKNLEERALKNEERQTTAIENMSMMMQQFIQAITTNNERLAQLLVGHAEHARLTQDALSEMRAKIAASVAKKEI